jgi:hypothetical protein
VDAINKCSIKSPAILSLHRILFVATVSDIHVVPFWVPSEENMIADAVSCYDYKRLADLGLQVSRLPKPAELHWKLNPSSQLPHAKHSAGLRHNPAAIHLLLSRTRLQPLSVVLSSSITLDRPSYAFRQTLNRKEIHRCATVPSRSSRI